MSKKFDRREFVKKTAKSAVGIGLLGSYSASAYGKISANDNVTVAVIGTQSRGSQLATAFVRTPGVDVAYICDVDEKAMAKGLDAVKRAGQTRNVTGVRDFRTILSDSSLDAVVIAMPDHWHAIATIMALQAGKHVYVEKPGSHNPREGELVVKAAKKHNRIVQVGAQRRSWNYVREAMNDLKSGIIGNPHYARTWYGANRGPIGFGRNVAVPADLDYDFWQGPAPRRPYRDNLIHYNWHWFWHWGTGELLNNGTHFIDLARLGLGVTHPIKVSSQGGRYAYRDDWETPDLQITAFDFPENKTILWEGKSCNTRPIDNMGAALSFHSEQGSLVIGGNSYTVYDIKNQEVKKFTEGEAGKVDLAGPEIGMDIIHTLDFVEAIRSGRKPNADFEDVNKSVSMLHVGNIAHRVGRTLKLNPLNGRIVDDPEAMKLWGREYEPGWEPVV
jgi:predicted dehydrogenase